MADGGNNGGYVSEHIDKAAWRKAIMLWQAAA
jgi:hypothetical protein